MAVIYAELTLKRGSAFNSQETWLKLKFRLPANKLPHIHIYIYIYMFFCSSDLICSPINKYGNFLYALRLNCVSNSANNY